jgi:hypothetical protein
VANAGLRLAAACGAAALFALSAHAQVKEGSETGTGLVGGEIPPLLKQIQTDPYRPPSAPACQTVPAEILEISKVIGPDFQSETVSKEESWTDRGVGAARGLIPYGGVVRFATGADKKDKALRAAVEAGFARRGFLRGVALNMTCNAPAPAKAAPAKAAPAKGKSRPK